MGAGGVHGIAELRGKGPRALRVLFDKKRAFCTRQLPGLQSKAAKDESDAEGSVLSLGRLLA